MSKSGGWLTYVGRLIVGTVREWAHLFALSREMAALDNRREELLLRLGKRYHQFITENRTDPLPAVAETVADLRAVSQRIRAVNEIKERVRQETYSYVHAPAFEPPGWAAAELASREAAAGKPGPAGKPAPGPQPLRPVAPAQPAQPPAAGAEEADLFELLPPRRKAPAPGIAEVCDHCGQPLPEGARFCPACGKPHTAEAKTISADIAPPRKCPHCGAELPLLSEFCPSCGGHIDAEVYDM